MSGPNFTDVTKLNATLQDAAAYTRSRIILTGQGEAVRLDGAEVSASLFDLLGVRSCWSTRVRTTQPHLPPVAVTLTLVSLAAAYVPARRATRVDPIVALRAE